MKIILPGLPPSKKNGRIIIHRKSDGRHFDIPSNEYQKWEKSMGMLIRQQWGERPTIDHGIILKIIFHVTDKRSWDLSNKEESLQDLLKVCRVISDDNRFIIQEKYSTWKMADSEFVEIQLEKTALFSNNNLFNTPGLFEKV